MQKIDPLYIVPGSSRIAADAHEGQKYGDGPYTDHINAVSAALAQFGDRAAAAGVLHDVLEDTGTTAADLYRAGVPPTVIATVVELTKPKGTNYLDWISELSNKLYPEEMFTQPVEVNTYTVSRQIPATPLPVLVKLADVLHNTAPLRLTGRMPDGKASLASRYTEALVILCARLDQDVVEAVKESIDKRFLEEVK